MLMIFFPGEEEAKVKMKNTLLVLCALYISTSEAIYLGIVPSEGIPLLFDTSDYKILQEANEKDYDFYADKCRGKQGIKIH